MSPASRYAWSLALTPVCLPLLHGALVRAARAAGMAVPAQAMTMLAIAAGGPVLVGLLWASCLPAVAPGDRPYFALHAALSYGGFGYAYFHLYNLTETGRRIRILSEFSAAGPMSMEELERRYAPRDMLQVRLKRLIDLGELRLVDGRYHLGRRVLWACARCLQLWSLIMGFPDAARGCGREERADGT